MNLFEPVHLALIIASFINKISVTKAFDYFKILIIDTPELKKTSSIRVYEWTLDLFESGIINEGGIPLIDFNEFKNYIEHNGTNYLKKLIRAASTKVKWY